MNCSIHFIEMSKKFQNHKGIYFEHNQTLILSKISKKVYDNLYKSIIFSHAMIELDNIKSTKKKFNVKRSHYAKNISFMI